jgi:uncharacterized protein YbaR (Trm112 family)
MIAPELLEILVCPETHQPVRLADEELIQRINSAIASGQLKNRAGETLTESIQGGLVREDGAYLYPIIEDIPRMLIGEAIPLDRIA